MKLSKSLIFGLPLVLLIVILLLTGFFSGSVIIAGFGRVGRQLAKLLTAQGIAFVAFENDARLVAKLRAEGFPVYFGDASRAEYVRMLLAAGAPPAANVLAAEVHQINSGSSDIVWGMQVDAVATITTNSGNSIAINEVLPINATLANPDTSFAGWIEVQQTEFQRLGVLGDWARRYATMDYSSEAAIVGEFHKFLMTGQLYRGSKPVMWSPVERTALADAEVEYAPHTSPTVWVKFKDRASDAHVVIWTTTPWTIPANRAVSFNPKIAYGLYAVDEVDMTGEFAPWAKPGDQLILADKLSADVFAAAKGKKSPLAPERAAAQKEVDSQLLAAIKTIIVADFGFENALYEAAFDPDNPASPVCYAFGRDADGMKPHKDSPKDMSKNVRVPQITMMANTNMGSVKLRLSRYWSALCLPATANMKTISTMAQTPNTTSTSPSRCQRPA